MKGNDDPRPGALTDPQASAGSSGCGGARAGSARRGLRAPPPGGEVGGIIEPRTSASSIGRADRCRRDSRGRSETSARARGRIMRDVLVAGIGSTTFGKHPETEIQALAVKAANAAILECE